MHLNSGTYITAYFRPGFMERIFTSKISISPLIQGFAPDNPNSRKSYLNGQLLNFP